MSTIPTRKIGDHDVSSATLRRAYAVHPISAVQMEYSPLAINIEDEKIGLDKTCRELGIPIVAYSPLGRGLLTGAYKSMEDFDADDSRRWFPKFSNENFPNILSLVKDLKDVGKKHNTTPGQVSLACLLSQDGVIPIPGTKKTKYLKENHGAIKINLTADEVAAIRAGAQKADAINMANGYHRYPEMLLGSLFADTVEL